MSRSSDASRSSFKFSFFPIAPEFVSVSSLAMTTTGTGVAVLAVLGLYTSVLMSSNEAGADPEASRASFQLAGDVVSTCVMDAVGFMDSAASLSASAAAMVW